MEMSEYQANLSKELIERFTHNEVRKMTLITADHVNWNSPFFWHVIFIDDRCEIIAIRYNQEIDRWYAEIGTETHTFTFNE